MQRPLISSTIFIQVLPEDSIAQNRSERNAILPGLVAIDELAPTFIQGSLHHREISAAARDIPRPRDVREERAQPVSAHGGRRMRRIRVPVRVEMVPLALPIFDQLHGL